MRELMDDQAGVIGRTQFLAAGGREHELRRLLRRRELVQLHPGVYVGHTGEPTWLQRAWAGVLYAAPAVLCGDSALRATDGPGRRDREHPSIEVAIDRSRRVRPQQGLLIHRVAGLDERAQWQLHPPRLRYEEAALDVALSREGFAAIAVLADAVQGRRTTAARLAEALDRRSRAPGRSWLRAVLTDIADGTCSVLEHGYLHRVERAHSLPRGRRQLRFQSPTGTGYRDTEYDGLIVELDGRLFHDTARGRDRDLDRDLDAALEGNLTVRLSWGQVFDRSCWTAVRVGRLMGVAASPCGPSCVAGKRRATG